MDENLAKAAMGGEMGGRPYLFGSGRLNPFNAKGARGAKGAQSPDVDEGWNACGFLRRLRLLR